jgi:recyclin-1
MDKFAPLRPVQLHHNGVGNEIHVAILCHTHVADIPAYARVCRRTAALVADDTVWKARWLALGVERCNLHDVLLALEARRVASPPTVFVDDGELTSVGPQVALQQDNSLTLRSSYRRAHVLLKDLVASVLSSPPHLVLASLSSACSATPNPSLRHQAKTLHLLSLFLSPAVQPLRSWPAHANALRLAIDRFDQLLLAAFDQADSNLDEHAMREAAESSWELRDPRTDKRDWEMGKVWAEKREMFYEQEKWTPLANFKDGGRLEFDAMDEFMASVMASLAEHGARAVRVFPRQSAVLLAFADRVANEVVGEYITRLLTRAREVGAQTFLMATAAAFKEACKIVDVVVEVGRKTVERTKAEEVV